MGLILIILFWGIVFFGAGIIKSVSILQDPNESPTRKMLAATALVLLGLSVVSFFLAGKTDEDISAMFYETVKSNTVSVMLFAIFVFSALSTLITAVFYLLLYKRFKEKADIAKATFSAFVFFLSLYFAFAVGVSSSGLALLGKDKEIAFRFYSGYLGAFYVPYAPSWEDEEEHVFVKGEEIAPYMKQSFIVKVNELSRKRTKQIQYVKEQIIPFSKENYHVIKIKEYKEKEGKVIFQVADTAKETQYISKEKHFIAPMSVFSDKQKYSKKTIFKMPESTLFIGLVFVGIAFYYTVEALKRVSWVGKMETLKLKTV